MEARGVETVGTIEQANTEAIATLEPDLILSDGTNARPLAPNSNGAPCQHRRGAARLAAPR